MPRASQPSRGIRMLLHVNRDKHELLAVSCDDSSKPITEHDPGTMGLAQVIHKIWCEVIGYASQELDPQQHFVELGGDSLLAARIAMKLAEQGLGVRTEHIFAYPSVQELTEFVLEQIGNSKEIDGPGSDLDVQQETVRRQSI